MGLECVAFAGFATATRRKQDGQPGGHDGPDAEHHNTLTVTMWFAYRGLVWGTSTEVSGEHAHRSCFLLARSLHYAVGGIGVRKRRHAIVRCDEETEPPSTRQLISGPLLSVRQHAIAATAPPASRSNGTRQERNDRQRAAIGGCRSRPDGDAGDRKAAAAKARRAFRREFFPDATDKDWNDWRWQSRHRVRTLEQIERMLDPVGRRARGAGQGRHRCSPWASRPIT